MPWVELEFEREDSDAFTDQFKGRAQFLIDESLGIEAARVLRSLGWDALFVAEAGLVGRPDREIMALAVHENRILLTHDRDFLDDNEFPPHENPGLIVLPGARGATDVLEMELARVLITIGEYRDAYHGIKVHIREDGTWAIRYPDSPRGWRHARLLRFERGGRILELFPRRPGTA